MRSTKIVLILLLITLYNCSTPYQPKGMLGGYSEEKILNNMYKVEFEGNQHSDPGTIQHYLLYRCAELTKEMGYEYFLIVNEERYYDQYNVQPNSPIPGKNRGSASGGVKVVANPDLQNPTSSTQYTGVYYIKLLTDVEEKDKDAVFKAEEVFELLGNMIKK